MRTKNHWAEALHTESFYVASAIALQLAEYARNNQLNHKSIKVLTKEDVYKEGRRADSCIVWHDAPDGWLDSFEPIIWSSVCFEKRKGKNSVDFYDI